MTIFWWPSFPYLQNTPLEKLDKKHFAKPPRGLEQNGNGNEQFQKQDVKELALVEAKIKKLSELLEEVSL